MKGFEAVFVTVTAPVDPETEMPDPAMSEVTPVLVMVRPEPITDCPAVTEIPVPFAIVPVATFAKVFAPEKYGILPTTPAVDVERPLNPSVAPESVIGHVAEIVACLLLKVVQSVVERSPLFDALAVGRLKVIVEPLPVIVKSVPLVDDANVAVRAVV